MTLKQTLLDGALKFIARFHPEIGPVVSFAIEHEADIGRIMPIIVAAAEEGGSAYVAAEKAAPKLAGAIRDFVHAYPSTAPTHAAAVRTVKVNTENATRDVFGLSHMTAEEEAHWMSSTDSDSRTGSG